MSDTVTEVLNTNLTDAEVASAAVRDPELRKLPAGSEEYKVALASIAEGKKAAEATAEAKDTHQPKEGGTDDQPKKKGLERRFSELTSERDAAKARAAELEARLAALEAKAPDTAPEPTIQADEFDKPKPSADKFDTYADYVEALADWKLEKREFDLEQKQQIAAIREKQAEVVTSWDNREKATKERVEGYDQLVDADFMKSFTTSTASREAMTFLLESDAGPDLLFELAEDDDKLSTFKSMSAVKQVAYLARLEAKYEKSDQKVSTSKAPPPSKGLPKGKTVVAAKSIDPRNGPLSFSDYQAWRKAQAK